MLKTAIIRFDPSTLKISFEDEYQLTDGYKFWIDAGGMVYKWASASFDAPSHEMEHHGQAFWAITFHKEILPDTVLPDLTDDWAIMGLNQGLQAGWMCGYVNKGEMFVAAENSPSGDQAMCLSALVVGSGMVENVEDTGMPDDTMTADEFMDYLQGGDMVASGRTSGYHTFDGFLGFSDSPHPNHNNRALGDDDSPVFWPHVSSTIKDDNVPELDDVIEGAWGDFVLDGFDPNLVMGYVEDGTLELNDDALEGPTGGPPYLNPKNALPGLGGVFWDGEWMTTEEAGDLPDPPAIHHDLPRLGADQRLRPWPLGRGCPRRRGGDRRSHGQHGVGVSIEGSYEIKRVDPDFFGGS